MYACMKFSKNKQKHDLKKINFLAVFEDVLAEACLVLLLSAPHSPVVFAALLRPHALFFPQCPHLGLCAFFPAGTLRSLCSQLFWTQIALPGLGKKSLDLGSLSASAWYQSFLRSIIGGWADEPNSGYFVVVASFCQLQVYANIGL